MFKTEFHQDLIIPISQSNESSIQIKKSDSFYIILVNSGYGHLIINDRRVAVQGPGVICINNNENLTTEKGSCLNLTCIKFSPLFINSNFKLDVIRNKRNLSLVSEDMDLFLLNPFINRDNNYYGFSKVTLDMEPVLTDIFNKIDHEIIDKRDKYWPCRTRAIFMELLFLIDNLKDKSEYNISNIRLPEDDFINQVVLYININYESPIKLTTLCSEFAINRTSLTERFQKVTGYTITNYINKVRIQMACALLKETHLSITEIMYKCGYNTSANFNKTFKGITDMTPKDFRAEFCK